MEILGSVAILFILILYSVTSISSTRKKDLTATQEEEKQLIQRIEAYKQQLNEQKQQYENNKINPIVNLSTIVNNVLDVYEQSNIQLPTNIIEQLSFMRFDDELDVLEYIEIQRNYWKLENTKKVYKKVLK